MANSKPAPTLADYVVQAITPALIISLVTSLIFFLLEILYNGSYSSKLTWLMFLFVLGAVLIARISMNPSIADRAKGYGIALGAVSYFALLHYVDYESTEWGWAINLGLIALIWWCSHRLTHDSTHIDEDEEINSEGALQAAGLEDAPEEPGTETEKESQDSSWLDRHRAKREEQRRKRTLGVWVVYFSLAALPIFGLGQSLIPVEETGRRQYVFWLMGIYLASGLGLLMATTFLSLRKYLRHRKIRMPASIVGTWLAIGSMLSIGLLVLGAFLPRPKAEYPLFDIAQVGSKEKDASEHNMNDGEAGKGDGKPQSGKKHEDPRSKSQRKDQEGQPANASSEQGSEVGLKEGRRKGSAKGKGQGQNNQQSKGQDGKQGKGDRSNNENQKSKNPQPKQTEKKSEFWNKLSEILKWIVLGIIALVCLFFLLRGALRFLSNFSSWAKRMLEAWNRFWAQIRAFFIGGSVTETSAEELPEDAPPPMPFSTFSNPFNNGRAHQMDVADLVRYTFAAVQAWAVEEELGRQRGETALEHANRIGEERPAMKKAVRRLALLYARITYGRADLPESGRDTAEKVWEGMLSRQEEPMAV